MKEVELTSVQTPFGNISFKEARLIVECKLTSINTTNPNDFYVQEDKDYIKEAMATKSSWISGGVPAFE